MWVVILAMPLQVLLAPAERRREIFEGEAMTPVLDLHPAGAHAEDDTAVPIVCHLS